jgi:hypothetical protein
MKKLNKNRFRNKALIRERSAIIMPQFNHA